jgi:electron transfer flavoprotein beta subunit
MKLNILVCIKSTVLHASGVNIIRSPELSELNPFDLPALETALSLKEKHGGTVTALSMGPLDAGFSALCEALAMGVDRAVLLCDKALAGSDTLATSTALGAAIKKLSPCDLVLFGTRTSDSDTGHVGPQTAVLLGLPFIGNVKTVEQSDNRLHVERSVDEYIETFEVSLPAALTIHPGSVQPRDISLVGIQEAFGKDKVEIMSLADTGLSPEQVGETGSGTKVLSMKQVSRKRTCEMLEGTVEQQSDALLDLLQKKGIVG